MAKEKLRNSGISDRNKELINRFDRACFMEGLSKPRRIKLISTFANQAVEMNVNCLREQDAKL